MINFIRTESGNMNKIESIIHVYTGNHKPEICPDQESNGWLSYSIYGIN